MNMHSRIVLLTAVALFALPLRGARAQIEAGRVIDDSTHAPLVGLRVTLLQAVDSGWKRVDTTRTDRAGLFQLVLPSAGVYRIGFVGPAPMFTSPVDTIAADSMNQREYALPIVRSRDASSYFEFQVDHPAQADLRSPAPEYPPELRARRIEGGVATQFVVTPDGRADTTTFKVLRMTDPRFIEPVFRAITKAKFKPGTVGGIPVRQMVQQAFFFNLSH